MAGFALIISFSGNNSIKDLVMNPNIVNDDVIVDGTISFVPEIQLSDEHQCVHVALLKTHLSSEHFRSAT